MVGLLAMEVDGAEGRGEVIVDIVNAVLWFSSGAPRIGGIFRLLPV